jgi:protoporphyrinogen oxidase
VACLFADYDCLLFLWSAGMSTPKTAVIIGAGPAGLTAALEFLRRSDIRPIVLEASQEIGGISRTIRYKGNRMDIGGHRFFSKSDRVMQWWMDLMPPEDAAAEIQYQGKKRVVAVPAHLQQEPPLRGLGPLSHESATEDETEEKQEEHVDEAAAVVVAPPENDDLVMLVRPRKSRIYYLRKFFDYPIRLNGTTIANLGPVRMVKIGISYMLARLHPIKEEKSLEDFLINRFGRELYLTFFKSYTEKVWGTPCNRISAEFGAQRIKGLSLTSAVKHFLRSLFVRKQKNPGNAQDIAQKKTDTSLIERFLYPKFGPGQLWEHAADKITAQGGEILMGWKVDAIEVDGTRILAIEAANEAGERRRFEGDYFFSTMPMRDLIRAMHTEIPANVRAVAEGLEYRDFITVGVLANRLDVTEPDGGLIKDTWIYIQEPDVQQLGRLQIFNNWSPYMLADTEKVWLGLEFFCYETDPLWLMPDEDLKVFAVKELEKIGILNPAEVLDAHVVRVPKTYPAYFGTYNRFDELRTWVDGFENLFLIGRNGMHKYNNQDHSMLTAMTAVDNILAGNMDKTSLWQINTEQEYHEEKQS